MSSELPRPAIAEDGLEQRDQLAQGSRDRDVGRMTTGAEPLIERPNPGMAPDRADRRHVQYTSDIGPAAADGAPTTQGAAVAIDRGDAAQRGDWATRPPPELRQVRQESKGRDGANAGDRPQEGLRL